MFNKIRNWFKPEIKKTSAPLKKLRDVDVFDTIWLQDKNGAIYDGWVFDKTRRHIIVTVLIETGELVDFRFLLKAPLSSTEISQDNRILYFNDPCDKEK